MCMQLLRINAHKGSKENGLTHSCKAETVNKMPVFGAFWRTYSACAYIMVSLSYTSCKEVRQDPITGIN